MCEFINGSYSRDVGYLPGKEYKQSSSHPQSRGPAGGREQWGKEGSWAGVGLLGRSSVPVKGWVSGARGGHGLDGPLLSVLLGGVGQGVSADGWGRPDSRVGSEGVDVASGDASGAGLLSRAAGAGEAAGMLGVLMGPEWSELLSICPPCWGTTAATISPHKGHVFVHTWAFWQPLHSDPKISNPVLPICLTRQESTESLPSRDVPMAAKPAAARLDHLRVRSVFLMNPCKENGFLLPLITSFPKLNKEYPGCIRQCPLPK